jgi:hypothetical protein
VPTRDEDLTLISSGDTKMSLDQAKLVLDALTQLAREVHVSKGVELAGGGRSTVSNCCVAPVVRTVCSLIVATFGFWLHY